MNSQMRVEICKPIGLRACIQAATLPTCISTSSQWQGREGLANRCNVPLQGVVKSYMQKHKWFRIEYEDGDRLVLQSHKLQSSSMQQVLAKCVLENSHDAGSAVQ